MSDKKRAYRYEVTQTGGAGERAVGESPHVIDWSYLGDEYTWNIVGGASMESRGFITGKYVDRGYLVDDKYVSDKELAGAGW